MSIIILVYLLNFSIQLFALEENIYSFEPYKNEIDTKIENITNKNISGKKYLKSHSNIKYLKNTTEAIAEVEDLLNKLNSSIKELAESEPIQDEDAKAVLKAFAELDGVLSYVYEQLNSGKIQLECVNPIDSEEIMLFNSLKMKFTTDINMTNDLKKIIAKKLADASKREIK